MRRLLLLLALLPLLIAGPAEASSWHRHTHRVTTTWAWRSSSSFPRASNVYVQMYVNRREVTYVRRSFCRAYGYRSGVALSLSTCGTRIRIRAANSGRHSRRMTVRWRVL